MTIEGKVALVTGASKGIGKAVAIALAKEGAVVVVNYNTDSAAATQTLAACDKHSLGNCSIQADITDEKQVAHMLNEVKKRFGHLDILINNAGIFDEHDSPESIETFERIFRTNFLAHVYVTNAARKLMTKGKVIFMSSIHGRLGFGRPSAIAYAAMKAALDSYMKNLAKALAPNVLVNSVAPGKTITPQWGEMDAAYMAKQAQGQLIERWIEAEEVADAVVFLAKNDAMCGEVLTIDGGKSLKEIG